MTKKPEERMHIIQQNIYYYDQIAGRYNVIMDQEVNNKRVRQQVAGKFRQLVPSGFVLDFGAGTGLDLDWMTAQGYSIIFCEPAMKMRQEAISFNNNSLRNRNIIFLDNSQTDFRNWEKERPFSSRVDGILANFAVVNCIPDIGLLFRNLAGVIKPGAHFLALFLDNGWKKILRKHPHLILQNLLLGQKIHFKIQFGQYEQIVFIHTMREIRHACAAYFNLSERETIPGSDFVLIHLIRK